MTIEGDQSLLPLTLILPFDSSLAPPLCPPPPEVDSISPWPLSHDASFASCPSSSAPTPEIQGGLSRDLS